MRIKDVSTTPCILFVWQANEETSAAKMLFREGCASMDIQARGGEAQEDGEAADELCPLAALIELIVRPGCGI